MVHLQWKDRYNINFMEIDEQHRSLLVVLNELIDLVGERGDPEVVGDIFRRLCQYALIHFATEEAYMEAGKYPLLAQHKAEHGAFIEKLIALNQTYDPTDPHLLEDTLDFLKQWYISHILNSDMKYMPFLRPPVP
jgi:hemerythrin